MNSIHEGPEKPYFLGAYACIAKYGPRLNHSQESSLIWIHSVCFHDKARIFLLVDLREFFLNLGSGGRKKINKKALKMTS